jgi:choline dehydrogenase-like flavoprotein
MTVVVVGGGITGLAAAARLAAAGVNVTLLERSDRLGGSVRTIPFAGRALDVGAEMIITGQPAAVDLCAHLGLGDDLVAPVSAPAHVWVRGRLRPLPASSRRPGCCAPAPTSCCRRMRPPATSRSARSSASASGRRCSTASSTRCWAVSTPAAATISARRR